MANKITIKRSAVVGKVPVAGDLEYGEIAINYADGNLFFKNSANSVTTIASTKFVSVTGNVTGNYFIGNGSQLTGVTAAPSTSVQNGTSNVSVALNSNVDINVSSTNIATFASTGVYVDGIVSATGDIYAGNIAVTTITGSLVTAAQPNITSVGTLTSLNSGTISSSGNITGANLLTTGTVSTSGQVSSNTLVTTGNATIGGDLIVNGNVTYINISELDIKDPIISLGRGPNNTPLVSNDGKDRGEQLWYYNTTEKSAFIGWDDSTKKLFAATDIAIANEIVTVNSYGTFVVGALEGASISVTGNVTGANINGTHYGSGAGLTAITGANVTGTVANATYATSAGSATTATTATSATTAGTVTNAAQGNITSLGTLTSLAVTGNIASGNITSTYYGSGAGLSSITGANVTGTVANATYATSAGSATTATSATTAGTVTTAAQPNITSVGTLTSLNSGTISSSGNITGANLLTSGLISATGNITAGNISGGANVNATTHTGTTVSVSGNVTGGNILTAGLISSAGQITGSQFNGSAAGLTSIPGANVTGTVANATYATSAGSATTATTATTATSATTAGTVTNAAQANITSVGTLTALAVTGNITAGNITSTYYGSGAGLTAIPGANVTGTVANATYATSAGSATTATSATTAGTVTTAAQGNITSVGTLTSLSVSGTVQGGNVQTAGLISATGNITGGNIKTGNITVTTDTITSANATLTIDPGTAGAAGLVVIAGNLQVQGTTTTIDSTTVTVNDIMINVANNAATSAAANGGGIGVGPVGAEYVKLFWDSAGNTWDSTHGISAIGTVTATQFTGSGAGLTAIPGANVTGTVANATYATSAGSATTATSATSATSATNATNSTWATLSVVTDSRSTAVGPNLGNKEVRWDFMANATDGLNDGGTYHGIMTFQQWTDASGGGTRQLGFTDNNNLWIRGSGTGVTTYGSWYKFALETTTPSFAGITNSGTNGTGNIGASGATFNTVFAKATSAQYADLAENYVSDLEYPIGTVVIIGGTAEITASSTYASPAIAGVISENPAFIMNSECTGQPVALQGRVPCRVVGTINKGDLVTSSDIPGVATRLDPKDWVPGCVIGKSLEPYNSAEPGVIEVLVGRL